MMTNRTSNVTEALILAGGFGTRLQPVLKDVPKALAPLGELPFLTWQLKWLAGQGVSKVILAVHFLADQIIDYARNIDITGIKVSFVHETVPLGTGGAILNAFRTLDLKDDILVINGDTLFQFSLPFMAAHHARIRAAATMAVASVKDAHRFGTVKLDGDNIVGFNDASGAHEEGIVNCGAYILGREAMSHAPDGPFSAEKTLFPTLVSKKKLCGFKLDFENAFVDIGTPESYAEISNRLEAYADRS